jgi:hypothetical protein
MALEVDWKGHKLSVSGQWTWRWLFLAPTYELHIDDEFVDRIGGPRVRPRLEAIVEDQDGEVHHITADLLSLVGIRPSCEIAVEGKVISSGKVDVQDFLHPLLIFVILVSTGIMIYLGPEVLRAYWPK